MPDQRNLIYKGHKKFIWSRNYVAKIHIIYCVIYVVII
jgi:hypothetical protein